MPLKHLLWCVFIKSQRLPAKFVKIINVHHFVVVKAALATFVRKYGVLPELLPIDTGVVHVHVQYCSCSCTCAFVRSCGNTSFVPYCTRRALALQYTYCSPNALYESTFVLSKVLSYESTKVLSYFRTFVL